MTPPVELVNDPDERDEVVDPEAGSPGSEDEEGVRTLDIGPARRQRAHPNVAGQAEEDPVLAPGVGVGDDLETLTGQGMKRVSDEELRRIVTTGCS